MIFIGFNDLFIISLHATWNQLAAKEFIQNQLVLWNIRRIFIDNINLRTHEISLHKNNSHNLHREITYSRVLVFMPYYLFDVYFKLFMNTFKEFTGKQ